MILKSLGSNGPLVSEIGIGTSQIGNVQGYRLNGKELTRKESLEIIESAITDGVALFDTSDGYGAAECLLGELPREIKDNLTIITKSGLCDDGTRNFSEEYLRSRLERSMKRLGVEMIDVFQLNKPSAAELRDGSLFDLLERWKREGLILQAGLIVGEADAGELAIVSGKVDCLQIFYNLIHQDQHFLIEKAAAAGLGVLIRSPLNSGLLSGAYQSNTKFSANDRRSLFFVGESFRERLATLDNILAELCITHTGLIEFAMRYLLSNKNITSILPGPSSLLQLHRYTACASLSRMSLGEMDRVNAIVNRHMSSISQDFQFLGKVPQTNLE
jgi:aryl-alcohol dehydrogenase-like predicted oxidoreductase